MPLSKSSVVLSNNDLLCIQSSDTPNAYIGVRRAHAPGADCYVTGVVNCRGIGTIETIGPIGGFVDDVCTGASALPDIIAEVWRHAGQHLANAGWEVDLKQFERE